MRLVHQHSKDGSIASPTSSKLTDNKLDTTETVSVGDKLIGEPIVPKPILPTKMSTMNLKQPILESTNTLLSSKTTVNNLTHSFDASKSFSGVQKMEKDGGSSNDAGKKSVPSSDMASAMDYDDAIESLLKNFMSVTKSKFHNKTSEINQKRILMQHLVDKIKKDISFAEPSLKEMQGNEESPQVATGTDPYKGSEPPKLTKDKNPSVVVDMENPIDNQTPMTDVINLEDKSKVTTKENTTVTCLLDDDSASIKTQKKTKKNTYNHTFNKNNTDALKEKIATTKLSAANKNPEKEESKITTKEITTVTCLLDDDSATIKFPKNTTKNTYKDTLNKNKTDTLKEKNAMTKLSTANKKPEKYTTCETTSNEASNTNKDIPKTEKKHKLKDHSQQTHKFLLLDDNPSHSLQSQVLEKTSAVEKKTKTSTHTADQIENDRKLGINVLVNDIKQSLFLSVNEETNVEDGTYDNEL